MCFAPQRHALFRHLNFQKWSEHGVFCTFWLGNVLRATTACTFSTSQLPKVVRQWCVLYILTWKCASRHNGVHFFDISTSKSGPTMVCFVHFDLEMCFAPQRRALFRHLNFQKWSDNGVFCTFWLPNVLRATTACNFSSLLWPAGSAPAALASLLFDPPEPQIIGKTQCFATFSVSRRSYLFAHLHLLSSDLFSSDSSHLCFSTVHIVGSFTSKLPSKKLAQSTSQYYFVLQSLHKVVPSNTLYYKACTNYFPVLLCTTKLAQSTSKYCFVPQSLHKALPSTTLYRKACTKHFPVLLCTTQLAQSTSQYYFVLQSLHKILPSTSLYYKACTKHIPVLLCTTKLAETISQYYFALPKACTKRFPVLLCTTKLAQSATLYCKAFTNYFPVLVCTTKLSQTTSQQYFVLQTLQKVLPSTTLNDKACTKHVPVLLCDTKLAQRKLLQTASSFAEKLVHSKLFKQTCTKKALTHSKFFRGEAFLFTHRSFYTQQAFTQRSFYTQQAFTHSKRLHTEHFHTVLLHMASLYTRSKLFKQRSF